MPADDPPWWTPRAELATYVAAGASYVLLGIVYKWLLNWVIGPLWLLAWVWLVPAAIERVRGRRR